MNTPNQNKVYIRAEAKFELLPWYVREYFEKDTRNRSDNTILNYCHDYIEFFNWLITAGLFDGNIKEIPLDVLAALKTTTIQEYGQYLMRKRNNNENTKWRKFASLKSLFHYLTDIAEDDLLNPYLSRNVMMKVVSSKSKLTLSEKAARIEDKILDNDETFDFRLFVAQGYRETIVGHPRILSSHIKNKERDLAIISVVLGSGLRISELLALDLEHIDWVKAKLHVTRKGNKKDAVSVSDIGLSDLKAYIDTRSKTYKVKAKFPPVFLSLPTGPAGEVGRLTVRSAQKMLERYVDAYGKPALSIHKLRHSFATNFHKNNKDIAKLKEQLGHEDINTTMIYTHIGQTEKRDSVNKADR